MTNFPVLISLPSDADLAAHARNDGWDIVFASADGTAQYSHEIESFDGETGRLVAWVNVPNLASSIDTVINLYYGNSGVTATEENPTGVWDNHFKGVWHLAEDPSISTDGDCGGGTKEVCDSTANNADGDSLGSMTSANLVASKINGGYQLDGVDDTVDTADTPFDFTGDFTLSAWVDRTPGGTTSRHIINKRSGMGGGGGFSLAVGNLGEVYCQTDDGSTRVDSFTPQGVVTATSGVQYLVAIRTGSTCRVYVNSTEMTSTYGTHTTLAPNDNNVRLGSNVNNTDYWVGYLDELRASDTARSVAWMTTEYNNQDSPSTFYSLGAQTANPCVPPFTETPGSSATPTRTGTATSAPTSTPTPTRTPTATNTPTATATATSTPTPTPTGMPAGLLIVNSTGDGSDANTGDGICQTSTPGQCTLRAAIQQANATVGVNTIQFNIPGGGPYTLTPASSFPTISEAVTIDGTTQPGFSGTPIIEINGASAGGSADCLYITGSNSVIKGLVIHSCGDAGIELNGAGATGNVVAGNHIGTNLAGTAALPNDYGVRLMSGPTGNTIGGLTAAERNVISGNLYYGVDINWTGTNGNVVLGNYIGTNAAGNAAIPNGNYGVSITGGGQSNTVGGTAAGARNVISGNSLAGVYLSSSNANDIQGNYIGTDAAGTAAIPNGDSGISLNGVGIGIGGVGAGNRICFNSGPGIRITFNTSTGNAINGNSICANSGLGIDLRDDGVTMNDVGDGDGGPNLRQNFPALTQARTNGAGTLTIDGSLNSLANTTFRVELFASGTGDPTGYGEGEQYLGYLDVTTDASGNATFSRTLSAVVAVGEVITSTATDPVGNTSEFSAGISATAF